MLEISDERELILKELEEIELKELKTLESIQTHRSRNAIEFFTRPNPPQALLLDAWLDEMKKVFIISGANRIGKTTIGSIIAISTILGYFPWSKKPLPITHKNPRKVRYIGQDWEKHIMQVVIPALRKWWPKDRDVFIRKNNMGIEAYWRDVQTGSILEVMSNKQESDLHEGWEGDLIVYDEPPKRDIRVANARGLVDRCGRELFCMTLLKESWIDREVIKAVTEDGKPDPSVFTVHGDIYSNVGYGLTEEGVKQFAKTLTEDERDARLKGIPSYLSGLIYPQFNRDVHIKKPFRIPLDWVVDIAIDVHPREKQAVLFIATSHRGERYLVEEIWENGDGTAIAEEIVRRIQRSAYRIGKIIIDPFSKGDKNNEHTVYDKVESVLFRHGLSLQTASKDKNAGILEIKSHLKGPNGEASLFFFDSMIRTIWEIEGYLWSEDTQKPVDKDDHMMENLYRLLLLDTRYTEPRDREDEVAKMRQKRNPVTGY